MYVYDFCVIHETMLALTHNNTAENVQKPPPFHSSLMEAVSHLFPKKKAKTAEGAKKCASNLFFLSF